MPLTLTTSALRNLLNSLPEESKKEIDKILFIDEVERLRKSLRYFIRHAWHVIEPHRELQWNWHIDAICEHLEAITSKQIRNLLINVPPGTGKSLLTTVFWPSWEWGTKPWFRYLCASYSSSHQTPSVRDNLKCRDLIQSDWYHLRFPKVKLSEDQNQKTRYNTTYTGWRIAITMGSGGLGEHPHRKIIDDPHNTQQAESDTERQSAIEFYDQTLSTRGVAINAATVVIMQRLHQQDLSGHLMEKYFQDGSWEHLCLPMEFEPDRVKVTSIGWKDPRKESGELLWPDMFPKEIVEQEKVALGSRGAAGQLQQRPSPLEGGLVKRHWWRFWHYPGNPLPAVQFKVADGSLINCSCVPLPTNGDSSEAHFEEVLQSWDMAFKDTKDSAFVAGQVVARSKANKYFLDQIREKLDFVKSLQAIRTLSERWPNATAKLVEDKANGPAVIATLKNEISGLIPVNPEGDKQGRANAVTPDIEAGNVYLPHPSIAPWVHGFIEEWAAAPNGQYWDQIDAASQALKRLSRSRKVMAFT